MEKKYISDDVESSGPTPGKYSMLSLGACVVGEISNNFYRELKPLNKNYIPETIRICSVGFRCLDKYRHMEEFNPNSPHFNPERVLEKLTEHGEEPAKVMSDFNDWIVENTKEFDPIETAAPIKFDGMFTAWYFDNFFDGKNPFGHSGEDINSMYRGVTGNIYANIRDLKINRENDTQHNALDDCIYQAREFVEVLRLLKNKGI